VKFTRVQRAEKPCANKWRSRFSGEWEIRAISCSRRDQKSGQEDCPTTTKYKCAESSLGASSAWMSRHSFLLTSPSPFPHRRISSRAFRPKVISYLYARAKNSRGKSGEASSFRSRVTNHLSRGENVSARRRSAAKGEIAATAKTRRAAATGELYYFSA